MKTCFALLLVIAINQSAYGQATTDKKDKPTDNASNRKAAQEMFTASAGEYKITLGDDAKLLTLNKKPVLNWTNPARAGENGALFLWNNQGRPEVVGCCFTYVTGQGQTIERHEFHTLATTKLNSAVNGQNVWAPQKGIEMKEIPRARKPQSSFARRKLQMKILARRFSGEIETESGDKTQLRLITAPLATYEPKNQACKAGALFSLADGTDPEILLLIECRDDDGSGQPTWKYGFARYHYLKVSARLDNKEVWKVDSVRSRLFSDRGQTSKVRSEMYVSFDK